MCIYTCVLYIYICETWVLGPKVDGSSSMGRARGHFLDLGGRFEDETVHQGSPWGDALHQADSDASSGFDASLASRFWKLL